MVLLGYSALGATSGLSPEVVRSGACRGSDLCCNASIWFWFWFSYFHTVQFSPPLMSCYSCTSYSNPPAHLSQHMRGARWEEWAGGLDCPPWATRSTCPYFPSHTTHLMMCTPYSSPSAHASHLMLLSSHDLSYANHLVVRTPQSNPAASHLTPLIHFIYFFFQYPFLLDFYFIFNILKWPSYYKFNFFFFCFI